MSARGGLRSSGHDDDGGQRHSSGVDNKNKLIRKELVCFGFVSNVFPTITRTFQRNW